MERQAARDQNINQGLRRAWRPQRGAFQELSMMKQFTTHFVMGLSLTLLFAFDATTFARTSSRTRTATPRRLIGIVLRVQRHDRTMLVRELASGAKMHVIVPEDHQIKLSDTVRFAGWPRLINFNAVMQGMMVDLYVVPARSLEESQPTDRQMTQVSLKPAGQNTPGQNSPSGNYACTTPVERNGTRVLDRSAAVFQHWDRDEI